MRSHICWNASTVAWLSRLPLHSLAKSSSESPASSRSMVLQRLIALMMALLLLPLAQVEVLAQQAPWQGSPQYGSYPQNQYPQNQYPQSQPAPNSPYGSQYAPSPQQGYGQPNYAQPAYTQPAPQQPYGQPYSQPPNAGQSYANVGPGADQPMYGQQPPAAQAFSAEQLEQMLAPIALYPDALMAQVLAAATYPAQVSIADQWLRAQGNASADQIVAGADAQNWDPSVKALTAFPQVLAQMDQDLAWTTDLGNAYYNQPQDVLQTVQVMRQRAQDAGTLQNSPQEAVTYDQGNIELAPPNPQEVYVPNYNPWNVYGAPVQPYPGFSLLDTLGSFLGSSPLQFGLGIAMQAFMHTGFGWFSWGLDWLGSSILFNHSNYYSRSTSVAHWGSSRGGGAWAGGGRNSEGYNRGQYNQPRGSYGRTGNESYGYNGAGRQEDGRGYARQPESYSGNRGYSGNGFAERSGSGYAARPVYGNSYGNGYGNYERPAFQNYAYNRPQPVMPARPQQAYPQRPSAPQSFERPAYRSGFYGETGQNYGNRPGSVNSSPQQNWRSPATAPRNDFASRGDFNQRAFSAPRSAPMARSFQSYSAKPEKSGGFHLFGGGHSSGNSYGHSFGGGKAPKSFGGGSHGGGGHSSSHGSSGHHH